MRSLQSSGVRANALGHDRPAARLPLMWAGFVAWIGSLAEEARRKRKLRAERELTAVWAHCQELMDKGDCDAKAFERAAILLHRAARYEDEIAICAYVREWAAWRERKYIFGEKMWLSSRYKRIMAREVRAQQCLAKRERPTANAILRPGRFK